MPLEVLPERGEDGAIRYACTRVRPDDAALAFVFDPPELRDQLAPGPRADYGLIRNAVEEIWRVLHQYYAMYKSQSWTTSAALDILLGVVARVVAGVANIRRLARLQIRDGIRNWRIIMLERRKV